MISILVHSDEHASWWDEFVERNELYSWNKIDNWLDANYEPGSVKLATSDGHFPVLTFKNEELYVEFILRWR